MQPWSFASASVSLPSRNQPESFPSRNQPEDLDAVSRILSHWAYPCYSSFHHDWLSFLSYLNQRLYHSFLIIEQFPAVATVMFSFVLFVAALALHLHGASAAPQSAFSMLLSLYSTTDITSSLFPQLYKYISDWASSDESTNGNLFNKLYLSSNRYVPRPLGTDAHYCNIYSRNRDPCCE